MREEDHKENDEVILYHDGGIFRCQIIKKNCQKINKVKKIEYVFLVLDVIVPGEHNYISLYPEATRIFLSKPINISSQKDLSILQDNQKVFTSGKVIADKAYPTYRTILLSNNITLYCNCKSIPNLNGKNISIIGIIDTFQKTRINILKLRW